jgi:hypothetical protein
MRGPLRWEWATLLCVAMSSALYSGQEQQWLQYRYGREVSLLGGGTRFMPLAPLTADRPAGVALPSFQGTSPFFAKWQTPMVKSGFLWVALDRTTKAGPCNRLYIDSNGDGRLDDETAVSAYQMDQYSAGFGPVKVIFQVEDGPVTYHLNFRCSKYRDKPELMASPGGWYEGDITVGGAKKHCILFDYDVNGTFDDRSPNVSESDRISIGEKTGQDAAFVGRYIEVDGVLYEPQIARDGACVRLGKAENVKFGRVRLPDSIVTCRVAGENGSFTVTPKDGAGSLPVGSYHVLGWMLERTDGAGAKWQANASARSEKATVEIREDQDAELDVGEPIVATLQASVASKAYSLRLLTTGRAGEQIELLRNGARPQAPKVRISNADGSYDRTFNFEYG